MSVAMPRTPLACQDTAYAGERRSRRDIPDTACNAYTIHADISMALQALDPDPYHGAEAHMERGALALDEFGVAKPDNHDPRVIGWRKLAKQFRMSEARLKANAALAVDTIADILGWRPVQDAA